MKKLVGLFVAGLVTLAMSFIGCSVESSGGGGKTPDAPVIKAVTITNDVYTYTAGATKTPTLSVTVAKPTDGADLFYSWMYSKENADYVEFSKEKDAVFDRTEPGLYVVKVIVTAKLGAESIETDSEDEDLILNITVLSNVNPVLPDPVVPVNVTIAADPATAELSEEVDEVILTASATVTDKGTLSYQWYKDGDAISGATSNVYTTGVAGFYKVSVTNTLNGKTSDAVDSSVFEVKEKEDEPEVTAEKPVITTQPECAAQVKIGDDLRLTIAASVNDNGVLTYQWYKNSDDSPISGAIETSYTVPTSEASDSAAYYCIVTNTKDGKTASEKSYVVTVAVVDGAKTNAALPDIIETGLVDKTYKYNDTVVPLEVSATSKDSGVITYKWWVNGKAVTSNFGDAATYSVNTKEPGTYKIQVEVQNYLESATGHKTATKMSKSVTITVEEGISAKVPTINSIAPSSASVVKEETVTITVVAEASDNGTLSYQWYKDGAAISGATGSTFTPDTSIVGEATYKVVVTNTISGTNVINATATNEKSVTVIVTEPVVGPVEPEVEVTSDMTVTVGKSFTLRADVTNEASDTVYTYQWYKAGTPIDGATSETYTTSEAAAATYNYSVTVLATKNGKTAQSSKTVKVTVTPADVTVNKVEITTTQKTVDVGDKLTLTGKATMSDNTTVTTGIKFVSSDAEVAKIEGTTLTGLKAGDVEVTASYEDGKGNVKCSEPVTITVNAVNSTGNGGISIDFNPEPVKPTLKISPASGKEIDTIASIKIDASFGYDEITANSVTINGNNFTLSEGVNSYPVSDFATTEGVTITVSATLTNSKGTATASATYTTKLLKEDPFTWDNVNAYFVLTDRFYNGDTKNDHSYYRQNKDTSSLLVSGYNDVATFHGGDIKGLTEKLDYLDNLGVNAIWITAPYEQAHGWCTGGGNGFAHYAFHGYYTQDWTYMDQNMGTIEEFRTFVNEAHKRGIRIVMDVVMNHTGYNTVEDMITYDFGNFKTVPTHGWLGDGSWKDNHTITIYNEAGNWGNWWSGWVRAFGDQPWGTDAGFEKAGSGDIKMSLAGLPDVLSEKTTSVAIPQFLKTKWTNESDSKTVLSETGNTCGNKYGDYKLPSVGNADWYDKSGDWRSDNMGAPADYQVMWLSAWVREFGIDGFRCDTAKHIDMYRWGQLKTACQSALKAWRNDSSKSDTAGAKDWDENFWMTGEHFGWNSTAGQGDYYTTGGFDSMINFSFNGSQGSGVSQKYPSESEWGSYLNINKNADSDNNGNRNNVLSYLSSHDTKLCRTNDQVAVGTMFTLLPGGIQIYYGDESSRPQAYTGCGDSDMMTRGDMNWDEIEGSKKAQVAHWGKVGNFRKYNPAVGAGTGTATKRSYSGPAGENKVAISVSGTSVDVSGLFADGTTVYNWYDGSSAKVSGGKVTFDGGTKSAPILVSEKNPANCGVTF